MDWTYWLPIILGIIPLVYGVLKWLYDKYFAIKKRSLSIEYIDSNQYFHKKNDKVELKVIYNNITTCDALVTLRIAIKNKGTEDIPYRYLVDPIKLSFSEKYEILEVSKVSSYDKIKPTIVYTADSISLSWALLKHGDQFEIEIIAQNKLFEKDRDLSVSFYNSMLCDINIDGIDNVLYDKQLTVKDKLNKNINVKIIFFVVYSAVFMFSAITTSYKPDFNFQLVVKRDSISMENLVSIYSEDRIVELDAFDDVLTIDEFNSNYEISGLMTDYPKRNKFSVVFYMIFAACFFITFVWLIAKKLLRNYKNVIR